MPVQKQALNINFSQGLDTKTDPYQVSIGKFLSLENSIFLKGGLLSKRNGYAALPFLSDNTSTLLTTFNGDLTAIGTKLEAFSVGYGQWTDRGAIQPITLSTLPLIRNNTSQSQADAIVASNGLICTAYTDQDPANLSQNIYKYVIADSSTGQNIIEPTVISGADTTYGTPRVFLLGSYFIIVFTSTGPTYNLKYIAMSTNNPSMVIGPVVITTSYAPASGLSFDGAVYNNTLYFAWNGASSSGVKMTYLSNTLALASSITVDASHPAALMSVTADSINGVIWATYFDSGNTNVYTVAVSSSLNSALAPTVIVVGNPVINLTTTAEAGILTLFWENTGIYPYGSSIATDLITKTTMTQGGVGSSQVLVLLSVGLASKAFIVNSKSYLLCSYQSPYQSTYFLSDSDGNVIAKIAYGNGNGYLRAGLPNVSVFGSEAKVCYLLKDLVQSVNKNTNVPSGSQVAGIYSQLGINLVSFTISAQDVLTAEIGENLNLSGGFLWGYDGYTPTEQGFFLYPDYIGLTPSTSGGSLTAQTYFYQVTYEWTDNQGNAFRSAPSIPVSVTTTGSTSSVAVHVPSLRLTYKIANPVKIVIYRWSTAQQNYYQITSIATPVLNNPTADSVTFTDTLADSSILGNNLLYTTGGVLENIGAPAFDSVFIFDDRLWGIDSEDKNLVWFSKQVLEQTPVEMSDLQTIYVAPNIGAQGSTGPLLCGAQMDDKAILFKKTAINYIAGTGPDATGANNQYTQPVFITATVGCSNQKSIVFQPGGLMFEFASEAGNQIWMLGRDLTTQYVGAPVESLTQNATVQSAVNVPGTNQVRFTLSSGITLMFDYYYQQWGTFVNVPAVSSTLYQGLHTYINNLGQVFQESPGRYLDNASPVLMSFQTSWISLAGLQGYQRAYFFTMLGTYFSPHKLNIQVGYDYNPSASSQVLFTPSNFSPVYGSDLTYGSGNPYGGPAALEQFRVFFKQQRCESFQISMNEVYDASYGVVAGRGLTLSGIDAVIGIKKGWGPYRASSSVGAS